MADDKIDRALVQLTPKNYLDVFQQKDDPGHGYLVAARIATGIGHAVRDHSGNGAAHPPRRARGEPCR